MNWDAIGAIAETLGAVGVIASLVYLATQIRHSRDQMEQNTQALRAGSYHQSNQNLYEVMHGAIDNPLIEQSVRVGLNDFDSLDEKDAFRFGFWMSGVAASYDNFHYQYRVGMLDEERWQPSYANLRATFKNRGVAQWWRTSHTNYSPAFTALVEEILGEESDRGD
jgi:hypothetical protein